MTFINGNTFQGVIMALHQSNTRIMNSMYFFLNWIPQHVLADCRSLESHGFIKLIQEEVGRKALRP